MGKSVPQAWQAWLMITNLPPPPPPPPPLHGSCFRGKCEWVWNTHHYDVFNLFIIQTHCNLPHLLSYKMTATNFLSAMLSNAADWWKPCDLH